MYIFCHTSCSSQVLLDREGKNLSQLTERITPFRPLLFQTRRSNLPSSTRCIMRTWESSSSTHHRCYICWREKHDLLQIAPFDPWFGSPQIDPPELRAQDLIEKLSEEKCGHAARKAARPFIRKHQVNASLELLNGSCDEGLGEESTSIQSRMRSVT